MWFVMKKTDPRKMVFMYSRHMLRYCPVAPSRRKRAGEAVRPRAVTVRERISPKAMPWMANDFAFTRSLAPIAVAMRVVVPVDMPPPKAMMMKNTGKERESAASACVDMSPAK